MGISKGGAKKPKAAAAEAPPWPAPPPQADTEDQQGLFSMLHTLAQQLEAQKARADTAAARCSALSKEMEEREGRWKKRQRSWRKSHKKHVRLQAKYAGLHGAVTAKLQEKENRARAQRAAPAPAPAASSARRATSSSRGRGAAAATAVARSAAAAVAAAEEEEAAPELEVEVVPARKPSSSAWAAPPKPAPKPSSSSRRARDEAPAPAPAQSARRGAAAAAAAAAMRSPSAWAAAPKPAPKPAKAAAADDDDDEREAPFVETVRNKRQRAALPAHACAQCKGFFDAVGMECDACDGAGRHRARHAPVETPNSYWDMSGFGTAAHADAESEGLAKSPTPKSLLKKSRAIPGRADLRTFGRRASATDGALRVGGHVGL